MIDGRERIIEYGARGLRKAELNYYTSEKELLAVVVRVQHYHDYLNGQKFIIRTDHLSLDHYTPCNRQIGQVELDLGPVQL